MGEFGQDLEGVRSLVEDRLYVNLEDTPNYVSDELARKAGYRSVEDLAGPAMYGAMGTYGTVAPLLEPDPYEYPTRDERTYAPTRQISPSEYRTATAPPPGYDPTPEGEWSYYGAEGGIAGNLPVIYAQGGYGQNNKTDKSAEMLAARENLISMQQQQMMAPQQARQQAMRPPPNIQARQQQLARFMPSAGMSSRAYAKEGTAGEIAKALAVGARVGATETAPLSDEVISRAIEDARKYGATFW